MRETSLTPLIEGLLPSMSALLAGAVGGATTTSGAIRLGLLCCFIEPLLFTPFTSLVGADLCLFRFCIKYTRIPQ